MGKKIALAIFFISVAAISSLAGAFLAKKHHKSEAILGKKTVSIARNQEDEIIEKENIQKEATPPGNGIESIKELERPVAEEEKKMENSAPAENIQKPADLSFAILGDTQYFKAGANGGFQQAAASIKKMEPALVLSMGDLVSSCDKTAECEKDYSDWKGILGPLAGKTYPVQGNHDRTGEEKADAAWEKSFSYLPSNGPSGFLRSVYSFDFENSHFVALASDKPEERDISKKQLDWLETDLAKSRKENIFVFFHEPAYPTNSKVGESLDENPGNRDRLWSILKKYKVKAVFSGHEHIQSRRNVGGLYQFGFGNTDSFNHEPPKPGTSEYHHIGQAFGWVEVRGQEVTVKTYTVGGDLLNSFSVPIR